MSERSPTTKQSETGGDGERESDCKQKYKQKRRPVATQLDRERDYKQTSR